LRYGGENCDGRRNCEPEAKAQANWSKLRQTMRRGGKRTTSWKPGQSGNSVGSSRKRWELRRRCREVQEGFVDAVAIQLEITTAAAAELCRCGLVTPGYERDPQALPTASSKQRRGTSA
jgi:hypothetical protein